MRCTIDTNVPIVANGQPDPTDRGKRPSVKCRLASIEFLVEILSNGQIVIDIDGLIQDEYRKHLRPSGQPGVGDRFYLEIINSNPKRISRVALPKRENGEYEDLPQALIDTRFDPSDRKFAAIAKRENIPVVNATDSDWINHKDELAASGIQVSHICGCDPRSWFSE